MRFSCSASPTCLRQIREWLRAQLAPHLTQRCLDEICLAVDEACSNVVRHAYGKPRDPRDPATPLEVEIQIRADALRVDIRDRGESAAPDALEGRSLEDVRPGGLGWHFIRNAFPRTRYQAKSSPDGWNQLRLERPSTAS